MKETISILYFPQFEVCRLFLCVVIKILPFGRFYWVVFSVTVALNKKGYFTLMYGKYPLLKKKSKNMTLGNWQYIAYELNYLITENLTIL